jgi:hypothetical protein
MARQSPTAPGAERRCQAMKATNAEMAAEMINAIAYCWTISTYNDFLFNLPEKVNFPGSNELPHHGETYDD